MTVFTDEQYREAAETIYARDGELELAEGAAVSAGEDAGAYVEMWRWVTDEEVASALDIEIPDEADKRRENVALNLTDRHRGRISPRVCSNGILPPTGRALVDNQVRCNGPRRVGVGMATIAATVKQSMLGAQQPEPVSPAVKSAAEKLFMKAKVMLLSKSPFMARMVLSQRIVQDETLPSLAATDGLHIFYNPARVKDLTVSEAVGLLAHEAMHPILQHLTRINGRDHKKWNDAGDYVINNALVKAGYELPKGGLINPAFDGMSTEQVYAALPDNPDGGGRGGQDGAGIGHDVRQPQSKEEARAIEQHTKDGVAAASALARANNEYGKLPAEIQRLIDELLNPKVPWTQLLRRFVEAKVKDAYTWTRPNRRYMDYMPSQHSDSVGPIGVVFDTSGSVDNEMLKQFKSEVAAICQDVRPSKVFLLSADARAYEDSFKELDPGTYHEIVDYVPRGGGGTDFRPAFKFFEDQPEQPLCMIYLTDLMGRFPDRDPGFSAIWVDWLGYIQPDAVPFGEYVRAQ